MKLATISTAFDGLFATIAAILMSFIRHLSKFLVPIPPAWYWGTIISQSSGSLTVGVFAAIVLEIGGMLAAHYAIAYYGTAKGKLSAVLTVAYLVIGIGVMWIMESASDDAKLVITAIFIIAGMVYVLSAMSELENQELAAIEDDKAWEKEQEAKDRQHKRTLEARQQEIDAQKEVKIQLAHEQAQAEIAIASEKTKASIARAKAREIEAQAKAQAMETPPKEAETHTNLDELSGNKLEIYKIIRETPRATNTAIADEVGVSRQYVGQVRKELNGAVNGAAK